MTTRAIIFPLFKRSAAYDWCKTHIGERRNYTNHLIAHWDYTAIDFDMNMATFYFYDVDDKILVEFKLRFG